MSTKSLKQFDNELTLDEKLDSAEFKESVNNQITPDTSDDWDEDYYTPSNEDLLTYQGYYDYR